MYIVKLQDVQLVHRSPLHFYTVTMRKQKEIKETISFTIVMKRIKYLGVNLPKETKDLYIENCKTLMKESKEDTNIWRNILYLWIGRLNIMKMSILLKAMESLSSYQWYFSQN